MSTRRIVRMLRLAALVGLVSAFHSAPALGEKYTVTADRVNLRASPGPETKAMGQVARGAVLEGAGAETNGYVAVVSPESVDMWVFGELVKEGAAIVGKLHVRAGPGINYQTLGRLEKGEQVTVREEWNDWLKIAPPPHCKVWVSTNYVAAGRGALSPPTGGEDTAAPPKPPKPYYLTGAPPPFRTSGPPQPGPAAAATSPAPSVQPVSTAIPAALAGRALVSGVVQSRQVSHEGRIRLAGLIWRRPSKYRLVREDEKGRSVTACYVLGNDEQLSAFEGRAIVIHGREYWLQGVRFSVVIPDRISIPDAP
ncbi:MAG: SH3 domain-containing protein [Verrucomicrobiota bacterium]|nr:SH3 domain-containing protein [Verrucomicrobiota bacterium]